MVVWITACYQLFSSNSNHQIIEGQNFRIWTTFTRVVFYFIENVEYDTTLYDREVIRGYAKVVRIILILDKEHAVPSIQTGLLNALTRLPLTKRCRGALSSRTALVHVESHRRGSEGRIQPNPRLRMTIIYTITRFHNSDSLSPALWDLCLFRLFQLSSRWASYLFLCVFLRAMESLHEPIRVYRCRLRTKSLEFVLVFFEGFWSPRL